MAVNQHFAFPFKFKGAGHHAAVVEQDSDEDITHCVYLAALTPVGTRFYVPNFGITDPTFSDNRQELLAELQASEPRAQIVIIEKVLTTLEDDITIGVGNVG